MLTFSLLRCPEGAAPAGFALHPVPGSSLPWPGLVRLRGKGDRSFRSGPARDRRSETCPSEAPAPKRARSKPHPFNAALSASSDEGHVMDEGTRGKPKAALPPCGFRGRRPDGSRENTQGVSDSSEAAFQAPPRHSRPIALLLA